MEMGLGDTGPHVGHWGCPGDCTVSADRGAVKVHSPVPLCLGGIHTWWKLSPVSLLEGDSQPTLASWFNLPAVGIYQPLPPSCWGLLLVLQTLQNRAGEMHKNVLIQQKA